LDQLIAVAATIRDYLHQNCYYLVPGDLD